MRFSLAHALAGLASLVVPTGAVLYGDELYGHLDGRFWTFYSGGIAVIDPDTCSIDTTITTDNSGQPLPAGWSDGVYMQYQDGGDLAGYILINSRINRDTATGQKGDAYVVSTTANRVEAVVEVGPRVVHSYAVHKRNEFWTHSDGDGHFYVIDLSDIAKTESKVQAHSALPFHGKLLWDEDGTLGNRGYATATGEPFLFQIDLASATLTKQFDYSSFVVAGTCTGLHAISYSGINQHVYAECTGGGGIVEFDVRNGDIKFVHQHVDATGALYEVPDGTYVVAANKGGDKLHVFKPNGSGTKSSETFTVSVPGHPSTPVFYPTDNVDGGADFIACMPLTGNPNANQIFNGNVACDYYNGCTGATTATDVQRGVCAHTDMPDTTADPLETVTSVTLAQTKPYCTRCMDQLNFVNGTCTCSPNCGSCDANFPTDLSRTGVACVDLGAVVDGTVSVATLIPNAGAVRQGSPYGSSKKCTYGRTYRNHKRGEKYDASVSNYPSNSVVIVDMSTQTKKCQVSLPGAPSRIVFAPKNPTVVENAGPSSSGTATSSIMALASMGVALGLALL